MTSTPRITTTAAAILALAAASAPAASANPVHDAVPGSRATANVYTIPAAAFGVIPPGPNKAGTSQAVVRAQTPESGFDWGDAGIGAAGGLALAMLGVGGGLVISRQRPRRTPRTTAIPS